MPFDEGGSSSLRNDRRLVVDVGLKLELLLFADLGEETFRRQRQIDDSIL